MHKSTSLDSLNLQTSPSKSLLTSTINQNLNDCLASKSGGRKAIIPTPNRPVKKGPSDTIEFSSNDDTVVEKVNYSQTENKTKINQEDFNSFEFFIRNNFVPFSGEQSLYEWLDETEELFNRFKISSQSRYKAIPFLVQGDCKRKYISYRQSLKSFDDFYEFLLTHFDTVPSVSVQTQVDLITESDKSSISNDKSSVELKAHTSNPADSNQVLKSAISFSTNIVDKDTTNAVGDVSIFKSNTSNCDNSLMSFDSVISDMRKAILSDLIKHPKIFRGNKDNVIQWVEEIDNLMNIAHVPETSRLDLVSYSLRGDAFQWFKNNKGSLPSWNDFIREIKKAFTSSFSEELAFKTLESYTQGQNQPVRNFYNEVLKLCTAADSSMSESTKLKNLLNKVKPTIQLEVRKRKPKSPAEFLEIAKEIEELLQLSNLSTDTSTSSHSVPINANLPTSSWSNVSSNRSQKSQNSYNSSTQGYSRNHSASSSFTNSPYYSPKVNKIQPYLLNQNKSAPNSKKSADYNNQQKRSQEHQNSSKSRTKSFSRSVNAISLVNPLTHSTSTDHSDSSVVCQICDQLGHDASSCPSFQ